MITLCSFGYLFFFIFFVLFFFLTISLCLYCFFFFFQAEDGIRDIGVTGVQTCALPISFCTWTKSPPRWRARSRNKVLPRRRSAAISSRLRPVRRRSQTAFPPCPTPPGRDRKSVV